jgi:uncharacterized protein (TIGR02421 family)
VLDAVRWPAAVEHAFHARTGDALPPVGPGTYSAPLPFDPYRLYADLRELNHDIRRDLGTDHPAATLLLNATREAGLTAELIASRGTPRFAELSRELYGTSTAGWVPALTRLLERLHDTLPPDDPADRTVPAAAAAADLQERFHGYFGPASRIRVEVCPALSSDAAAGNGYLKLRAGAAFSPRDVRLLEVHEGWAHLATTLNGNRQPVLPVLGRCTPSATRTQEGLAVFLELVTGSAGRGRVRKLLHRTRAVALAEAGADFRDVYRHYQDTGHDPAESYRLAARVFRGSTPTGGPFTKDLSYGEGLLKVLTFVKSELSGGGWGRVPLLLCGKAAVEDAGSLAELGRTGWLAPPRWVPPPLRDRAGLLGRLAAIEP